MIALPERVTYRSYTEAEVDRLGVPLATLEGVLKCVLLSLTEPAEFIPRQREEHLPCS